MKPATSLALDRALDFLLRREVPTIIGAAQTNTIEQPPRVIVDSVAMALACSVESPIPARYDLRPEDLAAWRIVARNFIESMRLLGIRLEKDR